MTTGSCLCGRVAFSVSELASGVFKCHCSKCRKAFGGASSAATLAPAAAFSWHSGEDAIREFRTESGFLRRFCGECGSILPQHLPDYGSYWVPAGLLDDDTGLALTRHIHVASRAGWEVLDEATRQHPEGFDS